MINITPIGVTGFCSSAINNHVIRNLLLVQNSTHTLTQIDCALSLATELSKSSIKQVSFIGLPPAITKTLARVLKANNIQVEIHHE